MKWFKFYGQDYLSDPKILALSSSERSCWITLLSYGSVNDNGMITFLDEDQLMMQAGVSPMHEEWEQTQGVLKKMEKLNMIQIDNEVITIINWQKRQDTSLTGYERVKRWREKKRDDNTKITSDKIRVDKIRKEKKITIESTPAQEMKDFINNPNIVFSLLMEKGGDENTVRRELSKFISYWTERNKSGTKQRWELQPTFDVKRRLSTWFSKIQDFNKKPKINVYE